MKDLVTFVAKALVDKPECVQVDEVERDDVFVQMLRVDQEDLGKVIGKQGSTAKAIRTLLTATATKQGKKSKLEIVE